MGGNNSKVTWDSSINQLKGFRNIVRIPSVPILIGLAQPNDIRFILNTRKNDPHFSCGVNLPCLSILVVFDSNLFPEAQSVSCTNSARILLQVI